MQTKTHSILESVCNVIIGYVIAVISQIIIFPFFNIHVSLSNNLLIAIWFTMISICRSYIIRRYFTRRTENECRET